MPVAQSRTAAAAIEVKYSSPSSAGLQQLHADAPAPPSPSSGAGKDRPRGQGQQGHARVSGGELAVASGDILAHISDSQVKPIVNNRAIETIEKHAWSGKVPSSAAHFQPMTLEQLSALSAAKVESHLSQVSSQRSLVKS